MTSDGGPTQSTQIPVESLTPRQLVLLADAALLKREFALAAKLYRRVVELAPDLPNAHARLGLAERPSRRSRAMLEVIRAVEADVDSPRVFAGEGIATWLKSPPFIADARFMALADAHANLAPAGVANWHWNLLTVLNAVQQVRDLPGDFVELGVYKGHTTRFVADYVEFAAWPRRWFLYDTFEGVPADQRDPGREDLDPGVYGEAFSQAEVAARFADIPNVVVTKGRVPEVLSEVCPETIAFMHVDLNNAAAEVAALDLLYDRLVPGGVIVFDDFLWASSKAQYEAESRWFTARGLTVFALATGQGLFVKPPAR